MSTEQVSNEVVTTVDLEQYGFTKVASGKVREIFEIDEDTLLFVATDRISAYDVVMANGIPSKGALLTQLSAHWFHLIATTLPALRTHLLSTSLPPPTPAQNIPQTLRAALAPRTMQVRRLPLVPLESIVRGYLTGSAWAEYQRSGTVHGIALPAGMRESQKLATPLWTPSTKAEQGAHDENISPARAAEIVGTEVARRVEEISLLVYQMAHDHALPLGILIADTKFEFGLDPASHELVLVDEVLTPDSSRFWPADSYTVGQGQASYDKQFLRDWLTGAGLKGKEGVAMPESVVRGTEAKYREAFERLTGRRWG
ncbi:hypothetical protein LTR08_004001 [Meristemomyces frigidus]|nr:hypothetical protein LTR08_004001 [Meristemomyces frigidus]